ncbi:MAG: helix-turn-helix transcriptional regulator [Aeriscardovia sp.]|nr:helix-turn-helix transcriptional regulator [Aeriscardovia sp.]
MTTFYEYVGAQIRQARIDKGYSQQKVADKIGISRGAYSQYETGKNTISMEIWFKLAEVLELNPDEIPLKALKISKAK